MLKLCWNIIKYSKIMIKYAKIMISVTEICIKCGYRLLEYAESYDIHISTKHKVMQI